jgi:predicted permease
MNHLKHALRQLTRRPAFSLVVILMLALGIGASTAIFSMFQQILLQPLPVTEPERLVNFAAPGPKSGATSCSFAGECDEIFSYPMFRDLEAAQSAFSGLAAHRDFEASLSVGDRAEVGNGILVSGGYFSVLGLRAAVGRLIGRDDEPGIGESAVVVLTHEYWRNRFGGDANVIGRRLIVNGQPLTIVGVAPEGFSGTIPGLKPQVFVPLTMRWLMEPTRPRDEGDRRAYWLYLFARLQPGVTLAEAAARINILYGGILNEVEAPLNTSMPDDLLAQFRQRQITLAPGSRGQSWVPAGAARPLTFLLGISALVLLIVSFNIANLLLARGAARAGEIAIRASLGASRWRLIGLLLTEVSVPALAGGVLSLPVAAATLRALTVALPQWLPGGYSFELNGVALWFAAVVCLATVMLFGSVPALQATRADPGAAIKGNASQTLGGSRLARFRAALVTTQIAFSMVLLVLAGLFAQSLVNVVRLDLGMDVSSVATFTVSPRMNGRSPERTMTTFDRIEERLAAEPGVTSVGSARIALLTQRGSTSNVRVEGTDDAPGATNRTLTNEVSPNFFRTLAIPVLAGRSFAASDAVGSPRVAIVNERLVRTLGLGPAPLGRRISLGPIRRDIEIVGVVADSQYRAVKDEVPAQLFLPRSQNDNLDGLTFYVRGVDADALQLSITRVIAEIDPELAVGALGTLERQVIDNVFLDRLVAALSVSFAMLATLLAALGLYGVLAYSVAQRTRELGLRLTLGATPAELRRLVLKQVGLMTSIGGLLGLAAAVALGRAAEALLFGLSGYEPSVLLAAAAVISAVVLAAAYVPARRASSIAPTEALRYE